MKLGENRFRGSKYQNFFVENQKEALVFVIELWELRSQNSSGWNYLSEGMSNRGKIIRSGRWMYLT